MDATIRRFSIMLVLTGGYMIAELGAGLWLGSLALKLKDNASVDTLKDNKEETIIAAVLALNTFMD